MSELISKEALKIAVLDTDWKDDTDEDVALDMIDKLPTVEERKHGRWIKNINEYSTYICPNCKEVISDELFLTNNVHFCLCCGARMDGE